MKIKLLQDWTWGTFRPAGSVIDVDDATLAAITASGAVLFEPVASTTARIMRDPRESRGATVKYVAKVATAEDAADAE